MSMSPTLIIPLQTAQQNKFKVRTLLDSGSGTNWIVKNILQHVHHTKKGSEILEVHSFHGAVKKKYQLVDVYYIDQHNNSQAITCYVHDSYVRHICLDMTTYLQSEYPNVKPYTLPCAISDPGDKGVDHGHESQGIGMVLCPASTNRLRTSHGIVHINELDILLEPTIFGVVVSGAIPSHLRLKANEVSVNCSVPQIVTKVRDPFHILAEKETTLAEDISSLRSQEMLSINPGEPKVDHTKALDFNTEPDTTKCRLFINTSSKPTAPQVTINQALYEGPKLIIELTLLILTFLLLTFMLGTFAIIANTENTFLCILIFLGNKYTIGYFWFIDPWEPNIKLVSYIFKIVSFVSKVSPLQLAAVRQLLIRDECRTRKVCKVLVSKMHIDNYTHCFKTKFKWKKFFTKTKHKLSPRSRKALKILQMSTQLTTIPSEKVRTLKVIISLSLHFLSNSSYIP